MFLISDKMPLFKNTAVQSPLGSKFGPKFGTFCPPCKKGGQRGSNVYGHFMGSAGGPTVGVVLAGACWAWAAGMEDI